MATSTATPVVPDEGYSLGRDAAPQWFAGQTVALPRIRKPRRVRRWRSSIPATHTVESAMVLPQGSYGGVLAVAVRDQELRLAPFNGSLLFIVAVLLIGGLVMAYSASQVTSAITTGDPNALFLRQLRFAGVGILVAILAAWLPLERVRRNTWRLMGASLLLLVLVPLVGRAAYGAQRWLTLWGTSFQPSELAKLALVIFFADWLALKGEDVQTVKKGLLPFAFLTACVLVLILFENDLGTIVVVVGVLVAMFFAAGARLAQLLLVGAFGGAGIVLITALTPFRRARVEAFLHPLSPGCSNDAAYHVCHAVVSLMSGGLFGQGLGLGLAKASYLPNPANDSIFAVIGEELGLVGCGAVLVCFLALAFIGFRISRRTQHAFDALLACGITCWLLFQAALNIGSVVSIIPFTGVPLPFFSIGGSSLVVSLAAVGLLLNISRRMEPSESMA